jgi:hypothetical protein
MGKATDSYFLTVLEAKKSKNQQCLLPLRPVGEPSLFLLMLWWLLGVFGIL